MSALEGIKRIVIITGASRGIGARLVVDLNEKWKGDTLFILIARDYSKLEAIKKELSEKSLNLYFLLKIDFSDSKNGVDEYKNYLTDLLDLNEICKQLSEMYVFYNHGTLELMPIEEAANICAEFYQTNVISVWKLLSAVRSLFPIRGGLTQYHINMSSKMAYLNVPSYSLYTSSRIARATIFKVLANEQIKLRVLNYQPGPVYTDMLQMVSDYSMTDQKFVDDFKDGKFLTPEITVKRLIQILDENTFENGACIDFYDYE